MAFPTETVYGLGARGLHGSEVLRIFSAKGRPSGHPLILHVDGEQMARALALVWTEQASRLAQSFWPGPLTLVVPKAGVVPRAVTGGLESVGLRVPRHPVALALIRATGETLAAPSANAHMHVSPTTAEHVVRSLRDNVDLVLDAGPCAHGIESTVVDLSGDRPRVLRAGATRLEQLRTVVPEIAYEHGLQVAADSARASPGLASRHYAPRTRVILAEGERVATLANTEKESGIAVGVITWRKETRDACACLRLAHARDLPPDAERYAHELFAALHEADEAALDVLIIERVPDRSEWWAVADRIERASRAL